MVSVRQRFWADLSLRSKGLIVVILPILTLLTSGLFTTYTLRDIQRAERLVSRAQDIQIELQDVHNHLLRAGAGVRGYLLTGRDDFVTLFNEARQEFPGDLNRVALMLEPDLLSEFDRLRAQVEQEFTTLGTMLDYASVLSSEAPEAIDGLVVTSQVVMDGLNTQFTQLQRRQRLLLETRKAERQAAARRFYFALAANVLVGIVGGLVGVKLFSDGVTRRVRLLETRAMKLVSGGTLIREPHSQDEIGQLALTLERTSDLLLEREAELKEANAAAFERLTQLTQSSRRMALLNRMGTALQAAQHLDEATVLIARHFEALEPELGGALYLFDNALDAYVLKSQWGQIQSTDLLTAEGCCGVDSGSGYVSDARDEVYCKHTQGIKPGMHYCRSLTLKGQRLGLLQLSGGKCLSEELRQTCDAASDHATLVLANLQLRDSLIQQATRDPLTGLYNRRYLSDELEQALAQAQAAGKPVSLILADIDHFKSFNDRLGHKAGDNVLKAFAELLRSSFRAQDIACRYGGEEFIVMLPGTHLEDARKRAERLRERVHELKPLISSDEGLAVAEMLSISLGVAAYPQHGAVPEVLIETADKALYRAKHQGRDQVVVAEPFGLGQ